MHVPGSVSRILTLIAITACCACQPSSPPTPTSAPMGVVFENVSLDTRTILRYHDSIPLSWKASSTKAARYVVKTWKDMEHLETCDAKRAPYPQRLRHNVKLTVMDAVTGETVITETLPGMDPPRCEDNTLFPDLPAIRLDLSGEPQLPGGVQPYVFITGAAPSVKQIETWLKTVLAKADLPTLTESDLKRSGVALLREPYSGDFIDADAIYAAIPEAWRTFSHARYEIDLRQFGVVLEQCQYGSGLVASETLKRIQVHNFVVIHDRQTKSMVGRQLFNGALPDVCPKTVFRDPARKTAVPPVLGSAPSAEEFRIWLMKTMDGLPDLETAKSK